ncbi:hypothetical protein [Flavobacterium sp.]|uniref:hypothetical protein n=1 Tax=Flavobacterium sp. TaxID=239 RepID=UPI00261F298E|nr:hypothetical protein [Flavobacterium sp.]
MNTLMPNQYQNVLGLGHRYKLPKIKAPGSSMQISVKNINQRYEELHLHQWLQEYLLQKKLKALHYGVYF